jgi:hypothetical protein
MRKGRMVDLVPPAEEKITKIVVRSQHSTFQQGGIY